MMAMSRLACAALLAAVSCSAFVVQTHPRGLMLRTRAAALPRLSMMFDRFGPSAVSVLMQAQQETRRMGCNEVGTEHLLLGVIQEPEGARNALTGAKIELESTRSAVSDLVGAAPAGDGAKKKGNGGIFDMLSREEEPLPFTGAAKRTFRGALEEAQRLNQDEVRSEHLLLAMLGDESLVQSNGAMTVLEALDVDVPALRAEVTKGAKQERELAVTGGREGGALPTLAQCGTDLTQAAKDS